MLGWGLASVGSGGPRQELRLLRTPWSLRSRGRHSPRRVRKAPRLGRGSPDDPRSLGSSPHLVQVRERIRINGKPISPELFTKYFWHLYQQLEEFKVPRLWLEGWRGLISPEQGVWGHGNCGGAVGYVGSGP